MFEVFENESEELKIFCKENNLVAYHSGGGCYHYQLENKQFGDNYGWLFNLMDDYMGVPKTPNDICYCGLWLEDVIEHHYQSNKIEWDYDYESEKKEIVNRIYNSTKVLSKDWVNNGGNINIENKKLKDIIPIVKNINIAIANFYKENK